MKKDLKEAIVEAAVGNPDRLYSVVNQIMDKKAVARIRELHSEMKEKAREVHASK